MGRSITFVVPGHPQGKGRPRAFRRGKFISMYTPEKTRSYESIIRSAVIDAMKGDMPMLGPVNLTLTAIFDIPASYSKKKHAAALANELKPAKKPDLDNITKCVKDSCNAIVFKDDAQIVSMTCAKRYGAQPMLAVTITEI